MRKLFFIFTYQRSVTKERYTPEIAFYGIRQWEEAYDLINNLQRENSAVSKADAQLEALEGIQKMLSDSAGSPSEKQEAAAEELGDLLDD